MLGALTIYSSSKWFHWFMVHLIQSLDLCYCVYSICIVLLKICGKVHWVCTLFVADNKNIIQDKSGYKIVSIN